MLDRDISRQLELSNLVLLTNLGVPRVQPYYSHAAEIIIPTSLVYFLHGCKIPSCQFDHEHCKFHSLSAFFFDVIANFCSQLPNS